MRYNERYGAVHAGGDRSPIMATAQTRLRALLAIFAPTMSATER